MTDEHRSKQQESFEHLTGSESFSKGTGHDSKKEGKDASVMDFVRRSLFGRESRETREEGGRSWSASELTKSVIAQADRIKTEASRLIAKEMRDFLSELDVWRELRKMLDGTTLEVEMKIRFRAEDEGAQLKTEVGQVHVQQAEQEHVVMPHDAQQCSSSRTCAREGHTTLEPIIPGKYPQHTAISSLSESLGDPEHSASQTPTSKIHNMTQHATEPEGSLSSEGFLPNSNNAEQKLKTKTLRTEDKT
ncbi:MAG: hypothetical protein AAGJ35_11180 [Myxococcota bacterium]